MTRPGVSGNLRTADRCGVRGEVAGAGEAQVRSRILAFIASLAAVAVAMTALARDPWQGRRPYGLAMMTEEERQTYWDEILALPTVEEKEAYWKAHNDRMTQRALERGVSLPPPPRRLIPPEEQPVHQGAPYFQDIMTEEERQTYDEELGALLVPAERRAYIAEHVERMRARGLARGVSLPSTADLEDILKEHAEATAAEPEDDSAEQDWGGAELDAESGFLDEEVE
jgi:hypothetical protein